MYLSFVELGKCRLRPLGECSPLLKAYIREDKNDGLTHLIGKAKRPLGKTALVVMQNYLEGPYGKRFMNIISHSKCKLIHVHI